ncbi:MULTISPECIES: hypothetical protein [unclassified Dermacoccus]|uniref:hypothetical protein n=1 Tax=unclassified Dermacoccus TaxID=2643059 RepID=UPI00101BA586|nr:MULTISPECIES: hypothetical protein [unclassified Dermacoccus]MBZ4498839.1 hypothetical protein [Dermacoccus sp. Tok2021]RYI22405.1 hypothetical protein EVU97_08410 [Dermacoccus sp. 147Ba]
MVRIGIAVIVVGLCLWGLGEYSNRNDEVIGANIGAGLMILASWAVIAIGAVITLIGALRQARRRG